MKKYLFTLSFILNFIFLSAQCDPVVYFHTQDNRLLTANLNTGGSTLVCGSFVAPSGQFYDIGFAPDKTTLYGVASGGRLWRIGTTSTCTYTEITKNASSPQSIPTSSVNSLSFLPDGTALIGANNNTRIFRVTITGNTYSATIWYTMQSDGNGITGSSGDFILLGDKVYAALTTGTRDYLYEIKVDPTTYNPVATSPSGIYAGPSTSTRMFGMSAIYGKLYGGFSDGTIREITLATPSTFTISTNKLSTAISQVYGMTSTLEALGQNNPVISADDSTNLCAGSSVVLTSTLNSGNQWYRNGIAIPGATGRTYTASTAGSYSVQVSYGNGCFTDFSNTINVTVSNLSISTQPVSQNYCQGETSVNPLSVTVSGGTGAISYQWYRNTANNNTTGTLISGATSQTYTPPVTTNGTTYYYAVVQRAGCQVRSSTATISVVTRPAITSQPTGASYCQNTTATALSVTATGATSYQWYRNTANSTTGGTAVGTNSANYTPVTTATGIFYYYVVVGNGTCSVTSNTAAVNVVSGISISSQPSGANYCQNATATALSVTATGATSYQWYRNTSNSTSGGTAVGTNSSTYTPVTTATGTLYYYVVVGNGTCSVTSNIAAVSVTSTPATPVPNAFLLSNTCPDTTANLTTIQPAAVSGQTYEWHTAATNPNTGTLVANPGAVSNGTFYLHSKTNSGNCYSNASNAVTVTINACGTCTEPGDFSQNGNPTKVGITVQPKQDGWPTNIPNGFIALQSKSKGMVITRVESVGGGTNGAPNLATDSVKDPKEGMLVYDLNSDCVKLFNGTVWNCISNICDSTN